ncbi:MULTISPECIES: cobalamin B12-binding domain-containing protein [unclassified Streptomyces]|uniref:cobalamin B12-binding domain-containing protein n=1 Tax=unclassified Streptomyces TaxID=2593676 RepID=UPI002E29FB1E|nr:methylaspartate mutase [Streptomyces sp. NBC_01439]
MNDTTFAEHRLRIVVSGLSSDAHLWNLVYLQLLLEDLGHQVTNLGNTTPDRTIVRACRTGRPDLLVISSVNGHGRLDGLRLISALRAVPALSALPVAIGGKLGIDGRDHAGTTAQLTAAGYDAVFDDAAEGGPGAGLARFYAFLDRIGADRSCGRFAAGAGAA